MPIENLTNARLLGLKHEDGEVIDARTGLIVRADRAGAISFSFRYRAGVARRRIVLGRYPAVSLADARVAVGRVREQVRNGIDPQQERRDRRETPQTLTFDELADLYIERYAKRQKSSWRHDESFLRANVRPAWGRREAASITRQDAARLLFDVVARAPVAANRTRSVLAKLFSWAADSALLDENPMLGVRKPHREGRGKTRTLNDDEIRVLWRALGHTGAEPGTVAALRTLLLLGQRPGEVAGMAVNELRHLDDTRAAYWEIPASRTKVRKTHVVPLPSFAREIIAAEIARQGAPKFIFASRFSARNRLARHSLARAFSRLIAGLDDGGADADAVVRLKSDKPTPHDLRRTVATGMARLGIPRDDRLAVLAHSYGDIHETYDRYERLPQKRAALEMWERHLRKVIADHPQTDGRVLPLWR